MKRKDYRALLDRFEKMRSGKKVEILWEALDLMQQYNGRSRSDCIVMAMGGDYADDNEE